MSLEDPLSKFEPGFPNGDQITVRMLLNHRSGIFSYTGDKYFVGTIDAHSEGEHPSGGISVRLAAEYASWRVELATLRITRSW